MKTIKTTEKTIDTIITLLKTDGINSKQLVIEILENMKQYCKDNNETSVIFEAVE